MGKAQIADALESGHTTVVVDGVRYRAPSSWARSASAPLVRKSIPLEQPERTRKAPKEALPAAQPHAEDDLSTVPEALRDEARAVLAGESADFHAGWKDGRGLAEDIFSKSAPEESPTRTERATKNVFGETRGAR
ncbi:MAG TPA: hypothetical protein VM925_33435 [Labilithrix sp.]|nr:hypothetical protein [Labilithrix sp.]